LLEKTGSRIAHHEGPHPGRNEGTQIGGEKQGASSRPQKEGAGEILKDARPAIVFGADMKSQITKNLPFVGK